MKSLRQLILSEISKVRGAATNKKNCACSTIHRLVQQMLLTAMNEELSDESVVAAVLELVSTASEHAKEDGCAAYPVHQSIDQCYMLLVDITNRLDK